MKLNCRCKKPNISLNKDDTKMFSKLIKTAFKIKYKFVIIRMNKDGKKKPCDQNLN